VRRGHFLLARLPDLQTFRIRRRVEIGRIGQVLGHHKTGFKSRGNFAAHRRGEGKRKDKKEGGQLTSPPAIFRGLDGQIWYCDTHLREKNLDQNDCYDNKED
jgi:hypothetical protein